MSVKDVKIVKKIIFENFEYIESKWYEFRDRE